MKNKKDFLSITDLSAKEIWQILHMAKTLKTELKQVGWNKPTLEGDSLVMIFQKPSLRTRLSFEIGMTQLGGHAVYLDPTDIGFGVRESTSDIAQVVSRMSSAIMVRTFSHKTLQELASKSAVPVINGLSDLEHPCQVLADFMTIWEAKERMEGLKIAFVGDGDSNVAHSLCLGSAILGMNFYCAAPEGYNLKREIVFQAQDLAKQSGSKIVETISPHQAVKDAEVVITDTWFSMGDELEKEQRMQVFKPYQVNQNLMSLAKQDAIFMHCLPAHRGEEVTSDVIDGQQSLVFEEAENRLHVQKAVLIFLLKGMW